MTTDDEPQAKRTRKRTATYAKRVELRLTEEQFDQIHALSEASRAKGGSTLSLSALVRASLDDGCEKIAAAIASRPAIGDGEAAVRLTEAFDQAADHLQQVRTDVRRIGHNVNQVARVANESGVVPEGLAEAQTELSYIRELLVALGKDFLDRADGKADA
ncbi:MobC family plasmid mobilization relaxosome protein [Propionibacterium freudenreichii]|uniref:MobC family plasmid mobilization relaxosome protein n=1 Tax=Propionibacterium freudenreichii TaxID=1744 RepID=UPI000BC2D810|nr:MobC family plasmid mobilization relaxosome protein [Propionibacterium freudenreichii]MDK9294497.1 plasmid mobilization relaxosome protein MobC [Propionibacterium freudenreichii]MDK9359827.1 plasmid mobilization relaxosome protein MobC [Propionibacterium freudenreichii]MDK9638804.1 plasmid mobilization relaxosome protein MobC [Propionibacterium freudenreichii]WGU90895.1 MobC family plasmid mobilization relaxosome protein [Propionibacterium freudenreichii]SCQ71550.1 Hypothetical protein PFR_